MCLQETKQVGEKEKESDNSRFKIRNTSKVISRNGVDIIIDNMQKKDINCGCKKDMQLHHNPKIFSETRHL